MYQGVVRATDGSPLVDQDIALRITLHEGSPTGPAAFIETHTTATNQFGLFTIRIGSVNPSSFSTIQWSDHTFFQETEVDTAGVSLVSMGTTQLLSVPYALQAAAADAATFAVLADTAAYADTASFAAVADTANHARNGDRAGSAFLAYNNQQQPYLLSYTPILVPWTGTLFDDGGNFSGGIFTCSDSGYYHFDYSSRIEVDTIITCQDINIYVDVDVDGPSLNGIGHIQRFTCKVQCSGVYDSIFGPSIVGDGDNSSESL